MFLLLSSCSLLPNKTAAIQIVLRFLLFLFFYTRNSITGIRFVRSREFMVKTRMDSRLEAVERIIEEMRSQRESDRDLLLARFAALEGAITGLLGSRREGASVKVNPGLAVNPFELLLNLKQEGTIQEYRKQFELYSSPLCIQERKYLIGLFLNGLKPEIRAEVKLLANTDSLDEMIRLAELVENKIKVCKEEANNYLQVREDKSSTSVNRNTRTSTVSIPVKTDLNQKFPQRPHEPALRGTCSRFIPPAEYLEKRMQGIKVSVQEHVPKDDNMQQGASEKNETEFADPNFTDTEFRDSDMLVLDQESFFLGPIDQEIKENKEENEEKREAEVEEETCDAGIGAQEIGGFSFYKCVANFEIEEKSAECFILVFTSRKKMMNKGNNKEPNLEFAEKTGSFNFLDLGVLLSQSLISVDDKNNFVWDPGGIMGIQFGSPSLS